MYCVFVCVFQLISCILSYGHVQWTKLTVRAYIHNLLDTVACWPSRKGEKGGKKNLPANIMFNHCLE